MQKWAASWAELAVPEGSSKSHPENSISFIFFESPHQVDMKNVDKCYKDFFGYFNALKTHGEGTTNGQ